MPAVALVQEGTGKTTPAKPFTPAPITPAKPIGCVSQAIHARAHHAMCPVYPRLPSYLFMSIHEHTAKAGSAEPSANAAAAIDTCQTARGHAPRPSVPSTALNPEHTVEATPDEPSANAAMGTRRTNCGYHSMSVNDCRNAHL